MTAIQSIHAEDGCPSIAIENVPSPAYPDEQQIRMRAYEKYCERNGNSTPGDALGDWLAAETELRCRAECSCAAPSVGLAARPSVELKPSEPAHAAPAGPELRSAGSRTTRHRAIAGA